jgi:hypothetical protein
LRDGNGGKESSNGVWERVKKVELGCVVGGVVQTVKVGDMMFRL